MNKRNLSLSLEHYIETIFQLEKNNQLVKSVEVAKIMGVSKPAVSKSMQKLIDEGLIEKAPYGTIKLTEEGREIGTYIERIHTVIRDTLMRLGISEEVAEKDCHEISHVISEESFEALERIVAKKSAK